MIHRRKWTNKQVDYDSKDLQYLLFSWKWTKLVKRYDWHIETNQTHETFCLVESSFLRPLSLSLASTKHLTLPSVIFTWPILPCTHEFTFKKNYNLKHVCRDLFACRNNIYHRLTWKYYSAGSILIKANCKRKTVHCLLTENCTLTFLIPF